MQLQTFVENKPCPWQISYSDNILLLGSCFSDNMARKLKEYYFRVTVNPTGTLYNPVSIAHHVSSPFFRQADVVFITFGTAWVYCECRAFTDSQPTVGRRQNDGQPSLDAALRGRMLDAVVDNCMKRPATDFVRLRLTVSEIVDLWCSVLEQYGGKRFVFTVSPIRHLKDGLHGNQLSKAVLLQAVDEIAARYPERAFYFPAYEILLDELRDYRFYAADMMHPSDTAVEYIWERFADTFLCSGDTRADMRELHRLWLDRQHRPLKPDSSEWLLFKERLAEKEKALAERFEWINNTPAV